MNDDALIHTIDRVLESGLTPDDVAPDSISELALLLQADAPTPNDDFAARMDQRLIDDWTRPEPTIAGRIARVWRRRPVIGGAVAAAACVALVVTMIAAMPTKQSSTQELAGRDSSDPWGALESDDYTSIAPDANTNGYVDDRPYKARPTGGGGVGTSTTTAVTGTVTDHRRYLLGSGMFLEVEPKQVPGVIADATGIVDELGGYAGTSSYDVERDEASGAVDLWVPSKQYPQAIAQLSELGEVERILENKRDRTASRNGLVREVAEDKRLLRGYADRDCGDDEVCAGQERAIRNRIELREQELRNLDRRISMALINLKVDGVDQPEPAPERWTIDWAIDEAGQLVERIGALAIIVAAILVIPLAIVVPAWLLVRRRRRDARDAMLDGD